MTSLRIKCIGRRVQHGCSVGGVSRRSGPQRLQDRQHIPPQQSTWSTWVLVGRIFAPSHTCHFADFLKHFRGSVQEWPNQLHRFGEGPQAGHARKRSRPTTAAERHEHRLELVTRVVCRQYHGEAALLSDAAERRIPTRPRFGRCADPFKTPAVARNVQRIAQGFHQDLFAIRRLPNPVMYMSGHDPQVWRGSLRRRGAAQEQQRRRIGASADRHHTATVFNGRANRRDQRVPAHRQRQGIPVHTATVGCSVSLPMRDRRTSGTTTEPSSC